MAEVRIIRCKEIESRPLPSQNEEAGSVRRIIYPPEVMTKGLFMGIGETTPGFSPHRWHTHKSDEAEGYQVEYPDNFEEIYFIISGGGLMQWKKEDGKTEEVKVETGDTIFMPVGISEHQLFNNRDEKLVMLFCGSPTPKVTFSK